MLSLFLKAVLFDYLENLLSVLSAGANKYIEDVAKALRQKILDLCIGPKSFSQLMLRYLYKSTIRPCLEYCCHIWAGAPITSLNLLDRVQRLKYLVGDSFFSKLQPFLIAVMLLLCLFFIAIFMDTVFSIPDSTYISIRQFFSPNT